MIGMKRKTIEAVLKKKIAKWMESIKDETLRTDLEEEGVILSGGAIASMLLGEVPNDYDIYLKSEEMAYRIAVHYVAQFNATMLERNAKNPARGIKYTPEVRKVAKKNIHGEEEDRVLIYNKSAGVAAEEQGTYMYFEMTSEDVADEFIESFESSKTAIKKGDNFRPVFLTDNAISLSNHVQLIIRFHGEAEEIHKNFDYLHCTAWYDSKEGLTIPEGVMEALLSRTLIYRGSLYPIASIFRLRKFIARGYRITAGQLFKICNQISKLDLTSYDILYDQLIGVDAAYMQEILSKVNVGEKIDESYLLKLIDEVF